MSKTSKGQSTPSEIMYSPGVLGGFLSENYLSQFGFLIFSTSGVGKYFQP